MDLKEERELAWLGDAVLSLYARELILDQDRKMDGGKLIRMSSNQFLSAIGNPTRVEAQIGAIYRQQGLESAFAWIRENLQPVFEKQEARRVRQRVG